MSKLGLALGGGGARGLAHIGVLRILEKEGIEVSSISGCSMGAIVGGLYAYYGNVNEVESHIFRMLQNEKLKEVQISDLQEDKSESQKNYFEEIVQYIGIRINAFKSLQNISYFDEELTDEFYQGIPDVKIENLKINFSAIATDLLSGEEINLTKGSLREVVRASSAIPGFFPPVQIDEYYLVDGSASESVPVGKVREIGADRVLAVDVTHELKRITKPVNVIDLLNRAEDITSYHLSKERLKEADLVIKPKVRKLSWADFGKAKKIITRGEEAVKSNLEKIKKWQIVIRICWKLNSI